MYLAESFPRVPKQSQASSMDTDPSPKAIKPWLKIFRARTYLHKQFIYAPQKILMKGFLR